MKLKYLLYFTLSSLSFIACRKYQDGPALTFISKNERIKKDWILDIAITERGTVLTNISSRYPEMRMRFRKDSLIVIFSPITEKLYGNWELAESKEVINWTVDHNPVTEIVSEVDAFGSEVLMSYDSLERFDIRRLTTDELWLKDKFNAILRFVPE